jgi:hypothetical protein
MGRAKERETDIPRVSAHRSRHPRAGATRLHSVGAPHLALRCTPSSLAVVAAGGRAGGSCLCAARTAGGRLTLYLDVIG